MTPYQYVTNNPIMFTDPTGMSASPIYGLDGKFLGTDSEGFQGEIIFMDEKVFNSLGGYNNGTDGSKKGGISHSMAKSAGRTLDGVITDSPENNFSLNDAKMVNNAITHVISQMSDIGNTVSDLHNGKTSTYFAIGIGESNWEYFKSGDNNPSAYQAGESNTLAYFGRKKNTVTYNLTSDYWKSKGEFTVNNIQNTAVHEILGHKIKGFSGTNPAEHIKAIYLQMNHSSWKGTTEKFKDNIIYHRNKYKKMSE